MKKTVIRIVATACFGLAAAFWILLMRFGIGMGSFGGALRISIFSWFWMAAPIMLLLVLNAAIFFAFASGGRAISRIMSCTYLISIASMILPHDGTWGEKCQIAGLTLMLMHAPVIIYAVLSALQTREVTGGA